MVSLLFVMGGGRCWWPDVREKVAGERRVDDQDDRQIRVTRVHRTHGDEAAARDVAIMRNNRGDVQAGEEWSPVSIELTTRTVEGHWVRGMHARLEGTMHGDEAEGSMGFRTWEI